MQEEEEEDDWNTDKLVGAFRDLRRFNEETSTCIVSPLFQPLLARMLDEADGDRQRMLRTLRNLSEGVLHEHCLPLLCPARYLCSARRVLFLVHDDGSAHTSVASERGLYSHWSALLLDLVQCRTQLRPVETNTVYFQHIDPLGDHSRLVANAYARLLIRAGIVTPNLGAEARLYPPITMPYPQPAGRRGCGQLLVRNYYALVLPRGEERREGHAPVKQDLQSTLTRRRRVVNFAGYEQEDQAVESLRSLTRSRANAGVERVTLVLVGGHTLLVYWERRHAPLELIVYARENSSTRYAVPYQSLATLIRVLQSDSTELFTLEGIASLANYLRRLSPFFALPDLAQLTLPHLAFLPREEPQGEQRSRESRLRLHRRQKVTLFNEQSFRASMRVHEDEGSSGGHRLVTSVERILSTANRLAPTPAEVFSARRYIGAIVSQESIVRASDDTIDACVEVRRGGRTWSNLKEIITNSDHLGLASGTNTKVEEDFDESMIVEAIACIVSIASRHVPN